MRVVLIVHNRAVLEMDDAVGIGGDARIVRDHDDGAASFFRDLPQQFRDLARRL